MKKFLRSNCWPSMHQKGPETYLISNGLTTSIIKTNYATRLLKAPIVGIEKPEKTM